MPFSPIDTLPAAPQRNDPPEDFANLADAYVVAMTAFSSQLNTFISELETAAALIAAAPAYTDAGLLALTGNTPAADRLPYYTGASASALATLTAAGRALLDDADASAQLTTLGLTANGKSLVTAADYAAMRGLLDLEPGVDYQAYDAELTALAGLTSAADKGIQFTGAGTAGLFDLTAFAKTILDDANAGAARTTLGALGLTSATFAANTISLSLTLSNGDTLLVQGGNGSLAGNTAGSITFGTAYTTAPVVVVSGGTNNTAHEGSVQNDGVASTTGVNIVNSAVASATYTWLAFGKA